MKKTILPDFLINKTKNNPKNKLSLPSIQYIEASAHTHTHRHNKMSHPRSSHPPGGGGAISAIGIKKHHCEAEMAASQTPRKNFTSGCSLQQLRGQRHNIHVMFLCSQKDDHLLNRLTSMLGQRVHKQGFCHVEICIPDVESSTYMPGREHASYLSSSIYNGETVTLNKTKTFANPGAVIACFA